MFFVCGFVGSSEGQEGFEGVGIVFEWWRGVVGGEFVGELGVDV